MSLQFINPAINIAHDKNSDLPPDLEKLISSKEFLTGRIDYYHDDNFIEIPKQYAYREDMFLLRDTYQAFYKMYLSAKQDGVNLKIISATRTCTEQQWIWEDKWAKKQYYSADKLVRIKNIMEFSAMPGTSRHHWGTEMDLNSTSDSYFLSGDGKKMYEWLTAHACDFGFCQVYDANYANREGHGEEKWHWSYYPISKMLPDLYKQKVSYKDIHGFSGSEYAESLKVIDHYVLSVYGNCCE